ncbi:unnamed protein product [Umbelopsis sp. WA50703]
MRSAQIPKVYKREQYDDENAVGFKIDFRFIVDTVEFEYDLGASECAQKMAEACADLMRKRHYTAKCYLAKALKV